MSPRTRYLQLLTAAGLADKDLERERIKAGRDASNTAALSSLGTQALSTIAGVGTSIYDKGVKDAAAEGKAFAAGNAGLTGELADRPSALAPAADRSKPAPLDDLVTYKAPKDFVTPRDAAGPKAPALPPFAAAQEPLRPTTETPRSPFEPLSYKRTAGDEAAATVKDRYKPADNWVDNLFGGGAKKAGQSAASAGLAAQITASRAAAQKQQDAVDLRNREGAFHAEDVGLKREGMTAEQGRFNTTRTDKQAETASEREFRQRQQAAAQGFQSGENKLNRTAAGERVTTMAGALKERTDAASARADAPKPVPASVVDAIGVLNAAKKNAASLTERAATFGDDLGTTSALVNTGAQIIGKDSPDYTRWRADLKALVADYQKAMSGAGVSDKESANILETMPNDKDSGASFASKMESFQRRAQVAIDSTLAANKAAGLNTKGLEELSAGGAPAGVPRKDRVLQLVAQGLADDDIKAQLATEGY